ncbi:MAG: hypothetical protein AAGB01_09380 [Cyanobacteria bacterium P01_F01_bin.42]
MGKPRSLFNRTGPLPSELEARRQLIEENMNSLNEAERDYSESKQKLEQWQAKKKSFEQWERSPRTQEMEKSRLYINQPETLERLERIAEGQRMFYTVRELLKTAGERDGKMRRIQGNKYLMETDGRSVWVKQGGRLIFYASDERRKGGIVQTYQMAMTEGDRQAIQRGAEMQQERLRQQQRRSYDRGPSL